MLPSKLNNRLDVPTTPATESTAVPDRPGPCIPMHLTDVCVVQLLVVQSAIASAAVNVASVRVKHAPVSVTLAITVATL